MRALLGLDTRVLYTVLIGMVAAGRLVELRIAERNLRALLARGGISTLHGRWTTRIVCLPGTPPVTSGPYRLLRHPNYLAVIVEMFALPLIHTAWLTAGIFSALNAVILRVRIRAEEEALARLSDYDEVFAGRPRLLPGGR
jgi:isoprenylcysteine carboxyl methyltransferase (ICMT) family protein YpbQ